MTAKIEVAPAAAAIGGPRLRRAESLPAAIREFSGLQLRDYGGAGGLKTINVRSLGSAHTAIFLDGAPIDNAQNAQVDLGRISTEGLERVELFQGQRSRLLQTAREYGSASALHLTSALPSPDGKHGFRVRLRGGAFGTISPPLVAGPFLARPGRFHPRPWTLSLPCEGLPEHAGRIQGL